MGPGYLPSKLEAGMVAGSPFQGPGGMGGVGAAAPKREAGVELVGSGAIETPDKPGFDAGDPQFIGSLAALVAATVATVATGGAASPTLAPAAGAVAASTGGAAATGAAGAAAAGAAAVDRRLERICVPAPLVCFLTQSSFALNACPCIL